MDVLVACEYSGTVREAFRAKGHNAWSCDLLPSDDNSPYHHQMDVTELVYKHKLEWDLVIAHPPCTHLAVSGARWFKDKEREQLAALEFVQWFVDCYKEGYFGALCIENPVSIISSRIRKPDQIIQPWQFGHEATKTTCLWLYNLPKLVPTNIVGKGERHITKSGKSLPKWYNLPPSEDRWKIRSKTYQGIADAMSSQWTTCDKLS